MVLRVWCSLLDSFDAVEAIISAAKFSTIQIDFEKEDFDTQEKTWSLV